MSMTGTMPSGRASKDDSQISGSITVWRRRNSTLKVSVPMTLVTPKPQTRKWLMLGTSNLGPSFLVKRDSRTTQA